MSLIKAVINTFVLSSCAMTLFFLLLPASNQAAILFDPGLTWRSIKTEHFWIHYHQGLESAAQRMSVIAEKVHDRLSSELKWAPALRTDVVLVDSTDTANGSASPYPFNRIQIYITRPEPGSCNSAFDDWLEYVFTHEYVHILDIDMVHGLSRAGRCVLGRNPLFYPNLFQPIWILEGDAVYHESHKPLFGRINSTYTDMVMRTEAISGRFKSIDLASSFPREWPRGRVPYLYGGLFVQYLEKTYGQNSFNRFMHHNADNIIPFSNNIYPIPFLFNRDAHHVYQKPFFFLWKEWQKEITVRQTSLAGKIIARGLTPLAYISGTSANALMPVFNSTDTAVYYIMNSTRKGNHLMSFDRKQHKTKRHCRVNYPSDVAAAPDDTVYMTDNEYYRTFSLYNEVYRYKKFRRKRTRGKRILHIRPFNSSTRFLMVTQGHGRYSLVTADENLAITKKLIHDTEIQLSHITISPDDDNAIVTVKDRRGFSDLVMVNLRDMSMLRLTSDIHTDSEPRWLPHGGAFIFVSDRSGVYNLWEYDLNRHTMKRITNVTGGLFSPDISGDGTQIAVASYEPTGHRIAIIDYPRQSYEEWAPEPEVLDMSFFAKEQLDAASREPVKTGPYRPWRSVFPAFFIPLIGLEEIYPGSYDVLWGVQAMGADTLAQHSYSLSLYICFRQMRFGLDVSYTLSALYPDITIGYADETLFFGNDQFPWKSKHEKSIRRILYRYGYLSHYLPFIHYNVQQSLQFTYYIEQKFEDIYLYPLITNSGYSILGKMQIAYTINTAKEYSYSISKEHGMDCVIVADIYHRYLGSDHTFYKVRGRFSGYFPGFYNNNVLMLGFRGGICIDKKNERPYTLGRYEKGYANSAASGEHAMGIRGYAAGMINGNRLLASTAELRFPVVQKDAGILTVPIMFRDFWLTAFFDYGNVFDGTVNFASFHYSTGIEAHIKLTLGYNVAFTGYVGYARGLTTYGEDQVYFGLHTLVEGRIYAESRKTPAPPVIREP